MITTRQTQVETEFVHWVLLAILAWALVLIAASVIAAADPMAEPNPLPSDMMDVAVPMPMVETQKPYYPEPMPDYGMTAAEQAAQMWQTLEEARAGRSVNAIAGWERCELPDQTAHWKLVALGAAYLQAGDLRAAEVQLEAAQRLAPANAVVSYFMGVLRLEQAAAEMQAPEGRNARMMVAIEPARQRATLKNEAIEHLHRAIAGAEMVRMDERLMAATMETEAVVPVPTVGDLLAAIGADNFVGKAHMMLFGIYLDRGELLAAEGQLDAAVAKGLAPLYGYQDLAEMFLVFDHPADAGRVAAKDLRINHPWVERACQQALDATRNVRNLVEMW